MQQDEYARKIAMELERYRADEAAGLLLRLPVPLGATVWRVRSNPACHYGVQQAEIFLFGNNFINFGKYGVVGTPIIVRGSYQKSKYNDRVDFNISSIDLLENVKGRLLQSITIKLPEKAVNAALVEMFMSCLTKSTENRSNLYFEITNEENHNSVQLISKYKIPITRSLINKLNNEEIVFSIN